LVYTFDIDVCKLDIAKFVIFYESANRLSEYHFDKFN